MVNSGPFGYNCMFTFLGVNDTESRRAYFSVDVYSVALQDFHRENMRLINIQKVMLAIEKMVFLRVKSNKLCLIIRFIIVRAFLS